MDQHEQIFTIQQVSLMLRLPKPTLRFWEKEFNDLIVPLRTQGGQRRYTLDHISLIEKIKKLREDGMPIFEIKKYFKNHFRNHDSSSEFEEIDFLADHIAKIVRAEIFNFFNFKN